MAAARTASKGAVAAAPLARRFAQRLQYWHGLGKVDAGLGDQDAILKRLARHQVLQACLQVAFDHQTNDAPVPHWASDDKIARYTYNARSETVAEKPSYRVAWRHRQYGLVLVDNFYEPSYEKGRAVRWRIELASGDPFGIACLWDRWTDPASGEQVVSFSMLTVNADEHPVMCQFHKPGDEKRTPVIIAPELHDTWLSADPAQAAALMTWSHMPALRAISAPKA